MINPLVRVVALDDTEICAMPACGNIIGSIEGPQFFIRTYQNLQQVLQKKRQAASALSPTITGNDNLLSAEQVNLNAVIFADDCDHHRLPFGASS